MHGPSPGAVRHARRGIGRGPTGLATRPSFDTPDAAAPIIRRNDDAPCALIGRPARLRASQGSTTDVPEAGWRGSRTAPMKQTYQPKKRHRAKEHGFRARMKTTGRPPRPGRAAGTGSQAADGLTTERGTIGRGS